MTNTKPKIELEIFGVLHDGEIKPMVTLSNLAEWLRVKDINIPFKDRQTLDVLADFFEKEHQKILDEESLNMEDSAEVFNDEE